MSRPTEEPQMPAATTVQHEATTGPFFVTVTRSPHVTRRAFATLDDAHTGVCEAIADAGFGFTPATARDVERRINARGGRLVLPDGTVIEVEPTTTTALFRATPESHRAEFFNSKHRNNREAACAAYNAAREAEEASR